MFAIRNCIFRSSSNLLRGSHRINHLARSGNQLFYPACRKTLFSFSATAQNGQQTNDNRNFVHNPYLTSVAVGLGAGYILWQFLNDDKNYLGTCEAKTDCGCSSSGNPPLSPNSTASEVLDGCCKCTTSHQQHSQEELKKAKKQAKKILKLLKEEYGVPGVTVSLKMTIDLLVESLKMFIHCHDI
jgi:hypothetical protein